MLCVLAICRSDLQRRCAGHQGWHISCGTRHTGRVLLEHFGSHGLKEHQRIRLRRMQLCLLRTMGTLRAEWIHPAACIMQLHHTTQHGSRC